MKKALSEHEALTQILNAPAPTKSRVPNPLKHMDVIVLMRKAMFRYGLIVTEEIYKCDNKGTLMHCIMNVADRGNDLAHMSVTFMNNYNKSSGFRMSLGARLKSTGGYVFTDNAYRVDPEEWDVKTRMFDIIDEVCGTAEEKFKILLDRDIENMRCLELQMSKRMDVLGGMFFDGVFTPTQMGYVRESFISTARAHSVMTRKAPYSEIRNSTLYEDNVLVNMAVLGSIIEDTHPSDFINAHAFLFDTMYNEGLSSGKTIAPGDAPLFVDLLAERKAQLEAKEKQDEEDAKEIITGMGDAFKRIEGSTLGDVVAAISEQLTARLASKATTDDMPEPEYFASEDAKELHAGKHMV